MRRIILFGTILMFSFNTIFGQLEWMRFRGEIPSNAVMGGVKNHEGLAVCRGNYQGSIIPGKVVGGDCNIIYEGLEKNFKIFEILINNGEVELSWQKTDGQLPDYAIQGGEEKGRPLYIGRAVHEQGVHPGKVFKVGEQYICNIGYGGKEITYNTFEVLVEHQSGELAKELEKDNRCMESEDNFLSVAKYLGSMPKKQQVEEGYALVSPNLNYQIRVTEDGRLVVEEILERAICDGGRIVVFDANEIWANTTTKGDASLDYYLILQEDGNLCIYSKQNGFVWCSMTNELDGHHLEITNIGHIEIVNSHGAEIWPD